MSRIKVFGLAARETLFPEVTATTFYRMLMLKKNIPELDFTFSESISLTDLYLYDVLYLSRPRTMEHLQFAIYAKKMGLKVIADWDDYVWEMPQSNQAKYFFNKKVLDIISEILTVADIVTCTTPFLKEFFLGLNKNVEMIPNAADWEWQHDTLQKVANKTQKDKVRFIWAGGPTHHEEMLEIVPALKHLLYLYPEKMEMIFFGDGTDFIEPNNQVKHISRTSVLNYFSTLHETEADVMLVPLRLNDFNKAKSNIRWIEATCANMVTIASPVPQFEETGCVLAKDGDWFQCMKDYIENPFKIESHYKQTRKYLLDNYCFDSLNIKGRWIKVFSK